MQYLLLIYTDETEIATKPKAEWNALYEEYVDLVKDLRESAHYIGGNPLESTATASTVRVRGGKRFVTDGPFAETKEQLGGYFLISAENLDEAIAIAERIPGARTGSVEVRPVAPHGDINFKTIKTEP